MTPPLYFGKVAIEMGAFGSPLTTVGQLIYGIHQSLTRQQICILNITFARARLYEKPVVANAADLFS